ncbi:uncharacterized protein LOC126672729 [Mercurialis annua]|uniref:uncharacterized protein LOC126672729 n=1 Tax=Mercurialis annua TaxID=3986 RepID=UPI00215FC67B|nr:uncharacterized protein LOC126672729 [Mercurialis annua]
MASLIPRFIVLRSNGDKYLRYVTEEGRYLRYVKCDGNDILDPQSKFRVERSSSNRDLVHIRCCYNNKYLGRIREGSVYVGAAIDAAEENRSKWSCTLFKPMLRDGVTYRFQHVQSGNNLCQLRTGGDANNHCLVVRWSDLDKSGWDLFSFTNWESLVILPKYIVFKGDNGKYLQYRGESIFNQLEFVCDDVGAIKVSNQTVANSDGSVSIKLDHNNNFWEETSTTIFPLAVNQNARTSFGPVKLAPVEGKNNIVALRSLSNNRFCRRTNEVLGTFNYLAAPSWATTIDRQANLQVEEPILSREVYDVNFRLGDLRVYNEQTLILATDETSNSTDTVMEDSEIDLHYEDTQTSSFINSQSVTTGFEMTFGAHIPLLRGIFSVGISSSYSVEYGNTYKWGDEKSRTNQLSANIKFVVPPSTKVTVTLVATKAFCDVPFSYAQRDTLTSGQQFTYVNDDGVYSGSNYFGFNFVVKEEPLPAGAVGIFRFQNCLIQFKWQFRAGSSISRTVANSTCIMREFFMIFKPFGRHWDHN